MTDAVSRFDNSTLTGALSRDAVALNNIAKATNDTAHNLSAESTIAGRSRNTFQNVYYSYMGGEAAGILENDVQYYIRGAGTPMDSQVKTHLSLLGDASFFPVQDADGNQYFTRVGTFYCGPTNEMQNHFGMKLLYTPAVNGVLPATPGDLSVLDCSNMTSSAVATSQISFRCGLSGAEGDSVTRAITVFDSSGTPRTLNYVFTRNADWSDGDSSGQSWSLKIQAPVGSTVNGDYSASSPVTIKFDANGCPASFNDNATPPALSITCPESSSINAKMNLGTVGQPDGVIRLKGGQSRLQVKVDGHAAGVFKSLETEENGNLYAKFDNGQSELVGRLAVGVFNNPDGLEMLDRGLYLENTRRSGSVSYSYIGEGSAGEVAVGALESSTIETIPQMAKMIERQQQFNNIITAYSGKKDLWELINSLRS